MTKPPDTTTLPAHLRPLTVDIPRTWTPEEALAVFELIEDIRDKILELHGERLREALNDQQGPAGSDESGDAADDDRPF